jgi:ABC-type Fe3+/spermidine/putrescine transport system ATPase subunit
MLEIISVSKSFGSTRALDDVSLTVNAGEVVSLLGPSGCGKSTLLAIVAGLEAPEAGQIFWEGHDLAGVPPHRRHFGLMFQDFALFPHRNVFGNVAFGRRMQGGSPAEIERAVGEALALVNLSGFERRDVNTLSGGEAQRVALARTLAPRPRLLMLDEPLGALDRTLRDQLLDELRTMLGALRGHSGQTVLYVTHDQQEAFALADRVAVMRAGRIVQVGTPEAVYARPASAFVARFLGLTNLLEATLHDDGTVSTPLGALEVAHPSQLATRNARFLILIRPEAARLSGSGNPLRVRVVERSFRGSHTRLIVQPERGPALAFDFAAQPLPPVGEVVDVFLDPERLSLLGLDA